jgi:hypothetical protein
MTRTFIVAEFQVPKILRFQEIQYRNHKAAIQASCLFALRAWISIASKTGEEKFKTGKIMEAKGITVIAVYRGQIPANADMDEVWEKIEERLDDYFRLSFDYGEDEEYDEDIHEPFFDQRDIIIAENGFQIIT